MNEKLTRFDRLMLAVTFAEAGEGWPVVDGPERENHPEVGGAAHPRLGLRPDAPRVNQERPWAVRA